MRQARGTFENYMLHKPEIDPYSRQAVRVVYRYRVWCRCKLQHHSTLAPHPISSMVWFQRAFLSICNVWLLSVCIVLVYFVLLCIVYCLKGSTGHAIVRPLQIRNVVVECIKNIRHYGMNVALTHMLVRIANVNMVQTSQCCFTFRFWQLHNLECRDVAMSIGRLRQLQNAMASLCISANTHTGFANVQIRLAAFVIRYLGYATSYVTQ